MHVDIIVHSIQYDNMVQITSDTSYYCHVSNHNCMYLLVLGDKLMRIYILQ